ncbi:hypothetical protein [Roseiconus lacunae]|uniref:Uncharacterized protein n=1 Tax=Roseiconus lacunae TaxID=2605694 RepID=A0ABT7PSL4_9BACT|nr:hypothetical protein [Roseiconus lacunae]MDM4019445.1 hypothetical protein [Roseiconus lacunae]
MLSFHRYTRSLEIWESNYGRDAGWNIERHGVVIATLSDPQPGDMFWDHYRIDIVTDDELLRAAMGTDEFWLNAESAGLVFRNRVFGEVAKNAFPSHPPFDTDGRIQMRALYLDIRPPMPWDWLFLYFCRRTADKTGEPTDVRESPS